MNQVASVTRCETGDGVWRVTLTAAANGNAVNRALIDELTWALTEACADENCRAVVIAAEGATFCRGLDLEEFFGHAFVIGFFTWVVAGWARNAPRAGSYRATTARR